MTFRAARRDAGSVARRVSRMAMALLCLAHIGIVSAGIELTRADTCSNEQHAAGDTRHVADIRAFANVPFSPESVRIREPSGVPLGAPCARETIIRPYNDFASPMSGTAVAAADSPLDAAAMAGWEEFLTGGDWQQESVVAVGNRPVETVAAAGASRVFDCSITSCVVPPELLHSEGMRLQPSAPGGMLRYGAYAFLLSGPPADRAATWALPLVIEFADQDDLLEVSWQGQVIFRRPLGTFDQGRLYWLSVPPVAEAERYRLLGVHLNAKSASRSRVYIPYRVQ